MWLAADEAQMAGIAHIDVSDERLDQSVPVQVAQRLVPMCSRFQNL